MAKTWNRVETWVALVVITAGGLLTLIFGVHAYVTSTTVPLHLQAEQVPSATQTDTAERWSEAVARARDAIRRGVVEQNLPGLSVAVGAGGEIVWAEGFGWADLETRTAVTPDTRFRIGTVSTALTSAAVGLLVEEERLRLDENIRAYVPAFPEHEWPVTLRQLMGHVAGIRTDSGDEGPLFAQHCERPVDALGSFASRTLLFEPEADFRYSDYGWILVSAAVEAAAKEPFLTFMQTRIFEPLGMDDTSADSATGADPQRASSYFPRYSADPRYGPDPMREIDLSCYAGASVFVSTPADLVRFALAVTGGTLLQPETVRLLQTPQELASGRETGYGLGWDLETATLAGVPTRVVGHDGELLGGMVASLMLLPERELVVAVTANTSYADTFALASTVAEAFAAEASSWAHK